MKPSHAAAVMIAMSVAGCGALLSLPDRIDYGSAVDASVTADAGDAAQAPVPPGPPPGPHCAGLTAICGPRNDEDCCAVAHVDGATFRRSYDNVPGGPFTDPKNVAQIDGFYLDVYETTIGRFRGFAADVADGGLPDGGAGRHPAATEDPGWDPAWNELLKSEMPFLDRCVSHTKQRFDEARAMHCLTWYQAFAFCIWDGGRLPTEAEWNYAAAGPEQRAYPWSQPPTSIDLPPEHAALYGELAVLGAGTVGRFEKGRGPFGHMDLAGNVGEWVVDTIDGAEFPVYLNPCVNCIDLRFTMRAFRGGDFSSPAEQARTAHRSAFEPTEQRDFLGVRCARDRPIR